MADYWKSQPRHFCEFCKCWTADNKPSRDFHERGKRHQENVQKKLDELRRKGFEDAKKEKETSSYLEEMEKGALSKLKEDLVANPKLASQYGVVLKNKRKLNAETESAASSCPQTLATDDSNLAADCAEQSAGDWIESTTPEGYVYYWNTVTRESRWELPADASDKSVNESHDVPPLYEQTTSTEAPAAVAEDAHKEIEDSDGSPAVKKEKKDESESKLSASDTETSSSCETEVEAKMSKVTAANIATATAMVSGCAPRAAISRSAYGAWEEVKVETNEPNVDLQLPQDTTKNVEQKTLIIPMSEPKIKFREKTVSSLSTGNISGSSGKSVGFRKPKSGIQRSIRTTDVSEES